MTSLVKSGLLLLAALYLLADRAGFMKGMDWRKLAFQALILGIVVPA